MTGVCANRTNDEAPIGEGLPPCVRVAVLGSRCAWLRGPCEFAAADVSPYKLLWGPVVHWNEKDGDAHPDCAYPQWDVLRAKAAFPKTKAEAEAAFARAEAWVRTGVLPDEVTA